MDPLMALAQKNSLSLIEDAAESHGAMYKGRSKPQNLNPNPKP